MKKLAKYKAGDIIKYSLENYGEDYYLICKIKDNREYVFMDLEDGYVDVYTIDFVDISPNFTLEA